MTREPTTPADFDAAESRDERERVLNARNIPAHEHYYTRNGDELACYCGESVTWADAEP